MVGIPGALHDLVLDSQRDAGHPGRSFGSADVNLELNDDQQFFLETTRRFIAAETPITTVRGLYESEHGFDARWWRQAAELGWTSMLVAESAGGGSLSGRPVADAAIVAEEIGRACAPGPFLPVNLVATALSEAAAPQHAGVLADLLSGESVASWAFGEPGDRWDPAAFTTTVTADGGEVVLRGTKAYIESGAAATHLLVVAGSGEGLTQVLVPTDAPGVTITAARSLDLVRRFAVASFDDARLPADAVVGEPGGAAAQVEHQLQVALALQCAETVGVIDRVFEFTLAYMADRYAFGRPIASYQALKHRVADMMLWLESAKGTTDAAIAAIDARSEESARLARVAKSYVGSKAMTIIQECNQFHGGISQTWEHDIHLYLRRATVNRAVFGTPEHHQERLCALLGM
jgi:alkylation response protein AidB-like acyl-CoA dehydrogenase